MVLKTVEGHGRRVAEKRRKGTGAGLWTSHAARRWRAPRFRTCCRCAMRCPQTTTGSRGHCSIVVWLSWRSSDSAATRSARRLGNTGSVRSIPIPIPIPIPISWLPPPKPTICLAYFCNFTMQLRAQPPKIDPKGGTRGTEYRGTRAHVPRTERTGPLKVSHRLARKSLPSPRWGQRIVDEAGLGSAPRSPPRSPGQSP